MPRATRPTWGAGADGWPYRLFTFSASVATVPTTTAPIETALDPGYHVHEGGALDLIIAGCSALALVAYNRRRLRI